MCILAIIGIQIIKVCLFNLILDAYMPEFLFVFFNHEFHVLHVSRLAHRIENYDGGNAVCNKLHTDLQNEWD